MDMQVPDPVRQAARQSATQAASAAIQAARGQESAAQYLSFAAAGSTFAMGIAAIKEIIEFDTITPVPLMPAFIRGVINLRGSVVPVIDLSARLGHAPSVDQRRTCIVIVEMTDEDEVLELGVVVDSVSEVLELGPEDLEPAPSFGAHIRSDFIQAMARIRGHFVIVLRLEQVLSVDEVSRLAHADTAAAPAFA